ncbi:glycosyltransferase [Megamonas funiformis]|uniref:glycosyltransferase n=1 Tax=Megamonas funiformis TaxID=437897 RepID=UPI0028A15E05|nr:glycosyltransferase [Megamonas funiformis]
MKKISVIVPVYNVEKYLSQCLDSIIHQTYKNLEIILVDDGSTDSSGLICDNYSQKDKRIKIIHKCQGSLSDARNAGLKIATGEYISFIDSDDFIDKNMYSILINNTQKYNSDIVWFNYYNYYSKKHFINSSIIKNNDLYDLSSSDKIKFAKNLFYQYKMDAHVWAKLYKRSIFNNIKFPYGKLFEDIFVLLPILSNAKIISTIPDCLYFYRNRSESIVNQYFKQNIIKNIDFIESRIILAINYKNHFPNIPESNLFLFDVLKTAFDTLYKFDNYHTQQKIITHLMSKLLKEKLPVKIKLRIIRRYFYALFKEINYVYSYKK